MMLTCQTILRISTTDSRGLVHTVDIPVDPDHTLPEICRAALGVIGVSTEAEMARIRDGLPAIAMQSDPALWTAARDFLRARGDLSARVAEAETSRAVGATPGSTSVSA